MVFLDFSDTRKCLFLKPRGHMCVTCHTSANRVATFVLREGLHGLFCTGTLRKLHTTQAPGKPEQDVLFKKIDFEGIGVNQLRSCMKDTLLVAITDWI